MVNKLFERNLLASVIVLSATMFDPNILLNTSKEKLTTYLKLLLKNLLELNILSSKQCDIGTGEFKKFIDSEVKNMKKETQIFSERRQVRLFLFQSCWDFKVQRYTLIFAEAHFDLRSWPGLSRTRV